VAEMYNLQFSFQAASPETFGYTLVMADQEVSITRGIMILKLSTPKAVYIPHLTALLNSCFHSTQVFCTHRLQISIRVTDVRTELLLCASFYPNKCWNSLSALK